MLKCMYSCADVVVDRPSLPKIGTAHHEGSHTVQIDLRRAEGIDRDLLLPDQVVSLTHMRRIAGLHHSDREVDLRRRFVVDHEVHLRSEAGMAMASDRDPGRPEETLRGDLDIEDRLRPGT